MKKIVSLLALALLTMSAWAANTYVKVTSLEQLVAGQKYILVNEENSRAMGAIAGSSTTYGSYVGITITDGIIDIEGTDVVELTADEGGTYTYGPTWHFTYDDGAYMFWNSGNSLSSISSDGANLLSGVKWVPALTTDGVILKNNGDISRILQYNASSPRFACYTSAQKPAVLYVQDASVTPPVTVAAPTLPESQEFENSLSVNIINNEEGADLMYALNDGEFTEYTEALTITETTTVHAKAVKGEVESEVVSATYTKVEPVVLTKPYVKVNSADELEVGKKYIIVNEERKLAMGEITGTSSHFGSSIQIPIVEDVAYIGGTDVVELTLGEGNMDVLGHATWTFEINGSGSYILWSTGNSLDAITGDGATGVDGAQWIADETEDGIVLLNKSDNARKLQYNASSPRFACYTSAQKPAVLYVEYVPAEEEGITKLSEANALADAENFTFNGDAVVTLYQNKYLFLRDESGYGQIRNVTEGNFENGQVLKSGWEATKTSNNGWAWFTDAEGLSASGETDAELAAAQKLTGAVDESMLNAYVYVENVTISGGPFPGMPMRSLPLPDGTSIGITTTLWATSWPAGGSKNIYGIICKVGDTYMFNVASFENYVAPFLRGDINNDGTVNISDVTALIDYLLDGNASLVNLAACDCNLDGSINISDATTLIDYLLNNEWPN
jgi:hypothetical protein